MANNNNDVNAVMALFKQAAEDFGEGKNTIQPYLLHGLRVMVENVFERQDSINSDMKEKYDTQLSEKQKVIDEKLKNY